MRTRIMTGAAAMAVALAAILAASPIPAAVLVGLLCVVGALEVGKLTRLVPWACLATVANTAASLGLVCDDWRV